MDPKTLTNEFKEFLRLLNENEVEYLVIGGHAVAFHGYPRTTSDLDVWIEPKAETAEKTAFVLGQFGFLPDQIDKKVLRTRDQVIRIGVAPNRIELSTGIDGVQFGQCYKNRIEAELDGVPVSFINLDHLKENKRASGRNKDLADLDELP